MTQESEDAATVAARELMKDQLPTNMAKIKHELAHKAGAFKRVFLSADGEEVLQALRDEFNGDVMFNSDPYKTAYNLGSRDLVVYIDQLLRYEA